MINLKNIKYNITGRTLLDNASLQLDRGQKAALIGRNGSGKSTLFKILLKEIEADSGEINMLRGLNIASVSQEVPSGDETPLEFLFNADKERSNLLIELDTSQDPNRIADIYDRLIIIDAYSAESRAANILKGLGFSDDDQNRSLSSFSGGLRMRIALAAALFIRPDLLLLDEPTNHLDIESIIWLEEFLKNYSKSVILISHEREFLNKVVDHVFHLNNKIITTYKGNYDMYEEKSQQKLMNDLAYNKKIDTQKNHMQKFVDRFKAKATKAKQAQSRIKAISKLSSIAINNDDDSIKFSFTEIEDLPSPIISFNKVSIGYGDKVILKNISQNIDNDDKIALLGANGNGKSTFAKLIAGEIKQLSGNMTSFNKLRIAYFNQHQYEMLDTNKTPIEQLSESMPDSNQQNIRSHLGKFGFTNEKSTTIIKKLSGGEKARLVFAIISINKPNILILDEPTNHLDIEMRRSLIFALNEFNGAVILISHDLYFIKHIVDKLWIVKDNTIKNFEGSIDDYQSSVTKKSN